MIRTLRAFVSQPELKSPAGELAPLFEEIFQQGQKRYGPRELSPNIIKRLEEAAGVEVLAPGFPPEMVDDEPEEPGYEVEVKGRNQL